jgi:hypothetical protein
MYDLTPHLPPDLLERSDEVLVLTQSTTRRNGNSKNVIDAYFPKGYQLKTINQQLTFQSWGGVGLAVAYAGGIPLVESSTSLTRICVLVRDGRVITLSGSDQVHALELNRREAIVSALRGSDPSPFSKVDGPCGMTGIPDWDKNVRARVANYIAAMRAAAPAADASALGRILASLSAGSASRPLGPPRVMVLIQTSMSTEPPLFLADIDFGAVRTAVQASKEADILRLLPEYASGVHALENVTLERFCAASADGHLLIWRRLQGTWEVYRASSSWAPEAIAALRSYRAGPACVPSGAGSWSASDRSRVTAFLESVRAPESPEKKINLARLRGLFVGADSASRASYMLIAVDRSDSPNARTIPLFLHDVEITHLVELLKTMPPNPLPTLLEVGQAQDNAMLNGFRSDVLCLVSVEGSIQRFDATDTPDWQVRESLWAAPFSLQFDGWRDYAIGVVQKAPGWDPTSCWLGQQKGWPGGLRDAVLRFLERMPSNS